MTRLNLGMTSCRTFFSCILSLCARSGYFRAKAYFGKWLGGIAFNRKALRPSFFCHAWVVFVSQAETHWLRFARNLGFRTGFVR